MTHDDKGHGGDHKQWTLQVENEVYHSDSQFITGAQVRSLGPGIPESMDLFLKVKGKPGLLIKDTDSVDLGQPGIEKFYAQEASSEAGCN